MSNKHYKDILNRTSDDTGIDLETLDIICKCFLYELAEEMVQRTVELPYIGDISLKNKKLDPNKFIKDLKNKGGSYAIKFRRKHAESLKRSREQRIGSSRTSSGSGVSDGISESSEDNDSN